MQVPIKPPVKENTMPVDLRLHSDVRAVERAEFDHQVHFNKLVFCILKCFNVYLVGSTYSFSFEALKCRT